MVDPISITTGVLSLLGTCYKIVSATKAFHDGMVIVDVKVTGLLSDVESFAQALQGLYNTLEEERVKATFQSTGHIGNLWMNLSKTITDGQNTLVQLQSTLDKINKTVGILDNARKQLRLNSSMAELAMFQQQIRSYRDTIQLTLQTFILWNQVKVKESTDKILPNLDELYEFIRRATFDINARIDRLLTVIESKSRSEQLESYSNLRACVQSAATVVASASTIIGDDRTDHLSVTYGSDFGDAFLSEPSESMLRWVSSNTIYELEEELAGPWTMQSGSRSTGKGKDRAIEMGDSDSEDDLETAKVHALIKQGRQKLDAEDYDAAERLFRNYLTRTSSAVASTTRYSVQRSEILGLLIFIYQWQEKWLEVKDLLVEKIRLGSRQHGGDNSEVLSDLLTLVGALLKTESYAEANLYARRAHKGYRRLGEPGSNGVPKSLELFIDISRAEGNTGEEEAYIAILSEFDQQRKVATMQQSMTLSESRDNLSHAEARVDADASMPPRQATEDPTTGSNDLSIISESSKLSNEAQDNQLIGTHVSSSSLEGRSTPAELVPGGWHQQQNDTVLDSSPETSEETAVNTNDDSRLAPSETLFYHPTRKSPSLKQTDRLSHSPFKLIINDEQSDDTGQSNGMGGKIASFISLKERRSPDRIRSAKTVVKRKLVIVGDYVGKSNLACVICGMGFKEYLATGFGNFVAEIEVDGKHIELDIWDTPAQEDYDRARPLAYPDTHVVLICFSIDSPELVDNVEYRWISEISHFCPGIPILLIGTKKDLRYDQNTIEELRKTNQTPVTWEQGEELRRKIGAYKYLECSAKTGEGVREVFEHACRATLSASKKKKIRWSLFGKSQ